MDPISEAVSEVDLLLRINHNLERKSIIHENRIEGLEARNEQLQQSVFEYAAENDELVDDYNGLVDKNTELKIKNKELQIKLDFQISVTNILMKLINEKLNIDVPPDLLQMLTLDD